MTKDRKYYHYSRAPLTEIVSASASNKDISGPKPNGLWLSVGDGWEKWCRQSTLSKKRLSHCTEITLKKGANVLELTTAAQVLDFGKAYAVGNEPRLIFVLDWSSVAARYGGIIISPYQWELRMLPNAIWYHIWDCASGCIWDEYCIEALTPCPPSSVSVKKELT